MSESAVILFDIQQSVFEEIETYQELIITDSKSEKEVRTARASVRQLRYKIQNRQKDLNKELNEKKKEIKTGAESLILKIVPTEDNLDAKIAEVETAKAKDKAEVLLAEQAKRAAEQKIAEDAIKLILAEEEAYIEGAKRQQDIEASKLAAERAAFESEKAEVEAERIARAKEVADKIIETRRLEQESFDAERRKINAECAAMEKEKAAMVAKEEARQQVIKDEQNAIINAEHERFAAETLRIDNEKKAEQKRLDDIEAKCKAENARLADEERQQRLAPSKEYVIKAVKTKIKFSLYAPAFDIDPGIIKEMKKLTKTINDFEDSEIARFCEIIRKF